MLRVVRSSVSTPLLRVASGVARARPAFIRLATPLQLQQQPHQHCVGCCPLRWFSSVHRAGASAAATAADPRELILDAEIIEQEESNVINHVQAPVRKESADADSSNNADNGSDAATPSEGKKPRAARKKTAVPKEAKQRVAELTEVCVQIANTRSHSPAFPRVLNKSARV
jgi:hypothetical protein